MSEFSKKKNLIKNVMSTALNVILFELTSHCLIQIQPFGIDIEKAINHAKPKEGLHLFQ